MASKNLILVTNDDGVHAPGLHALAEVAAHFGEVVIVAPHVERSASSHAITIANPLRVEMIKPNVYAVEGSPADCVMLGLRKVLKKHPTWVLSGINRGGNLGIDTLYSGTVGAAMEGALAGVRSMAVSCQGKGPLKYDTAAKVVQNILANQAAFEITPGAMLNVNIPSIEFARIKGISVCGMGRRIYENQMHENIDPRGRPYFWLGAGGDTYEPIEDSDCKLLDEQYVTMSVLRPSLLDVEQNKELKTRLKKFSLG